MGAFEKCFERQTRAGLGTAAKRSEQFDISERKKGTMNNRQKLIIVAAIGRPHQRIYVNKS